MNVGTGTRRIAGGRQTPIAPPQLCLFATDLGWMGIRLQAPDTLERVWFGYPSRASLAAAIDIAAAGGSGAVDVSAETPRVRSLVRRLRDYAQGRRVDFSDLKIDVGPRTDFQRAVLQATRRLKYGETASYGEIARRAGAPLAARAVGSVMAHNPLPLIIPCHRVVASGRALGGFSALDGVAMKQRLLRLEGALNETGALIGS